MTEIDAQHFLTDLISQLFHADMVITEHIERIETLEAEVDRLRAALAHRTWVAA